MSKAQVVVRVAGHAGFIELDRPRKANAYLDATLDAVSEALATLVKSTKVRVIVIASATQGNFCGGADLGELGQRHAAEAFVLKSLEVFDAIASCPKPTIAAIDGPAVAGGLELALACDLRLATDRARFSMPETSLGLIPAAGGTFRLARVVGEPMALQMILFGAELDAMQALACGLVTEVVAPSALDQRVRWWAGRASGRDGLALRLAKQAIVLALARGGSREFTACAQAMLYERRHHARHERPSDDEEQS